MQSDRSLGVAATFHRYGWTAVAVFGVLAAIADIAPSAGEPLVLRWLRTCADHPCRCALAGALAARALTRGAREPNARAPPTAVKS